MEGNLRFGKNGVQLDLNFETFDELKWFIQNMIVGPANKFGYDVQLVPSEKKQDDSNVGVL